MLSSSSRASRRRHQGEGLGRAGRALVGGVEAAHRLDLVAEEIEPQRGRVRPPGTGRRSTRAPQFAGVVRPRRCAGSRWRRAGRPARRARSARPRRGAGSAGGCGTGSARAGSRHWRWRPAVAGPCAAACSAWSVASRSAITRSAGRGAVVGQAVPRRAASAPRPRARTPAPCRPARASPLRRRRRSPRGRLAPVPMRRAREIGGEPRQEARGHAGEGQRRLRLEDALRAARSLGDLDEIELAGARPSSDPSKRSGTALRSDRPGHDVDVLFHQQRGEQGALAARPSRRDGRRKSRRSSCRPRACRDARRDISAPANPRPSASLHARIARRRISPRVRRGPCRQVALPALGSRTMRPEILNPLFAEVEALKGVGPGIAKALARLGLTRAVDLALSSADRDDRAGRAPAASARAARADRDPRGDAVRVRAGSGRAPLRIFAADGDGNTITLTFFNNPGWAKKHFRWARRGSCRASSMPMGRRVADRPSRGARARRGGASCRCASRSMG